MEAIRKIIAKEDTKCLRGIGIKKGLVLYVMKECPPHPTLGHRVLLVRVDNGTGDLSLMPETVVYDKDVE